MRLHSRWPCDLTQDSPGMKEPKTERQKDGLGQTLLTRAARFHRDLSLSLYVTMAREAHKSRAS